MYILRLRNQKGKKKGGGGKKKRKRVYYAVTDIIDVAVVCGGTDGPTALGSTVVSPDGTAREAAVTAVQTHSPSGPSVEVITLDGASLTGERHAGNLLLDGVHPRGCQ